MIGHKETTSSWDRFRLKKNFLMEGLVRPWYRLPKEVVESLFLNVFKRHVDVALRDRVVDFFSFCRDGSLCPALAELLCTDRMSM